MNNVMTMDNIEMELDRMNCRLNELNDELQALPETDENLSRGIEIIQEMFNILNTFWELFDMGDEEDVKELRAFSDELKETLNKGLV